MLHYISFRTSPFSSMLDRLPRRFVNHIELWLSGIALVVIFGIPPLLGQSDLAFWRLTALIAVAVGTIHGLIFWAVRRRQRQIRRKSIREIQAMLADVVKNRLTAIDMYLPEQEDQDMVQRELDGVRTSIQDIADHVDSLSEETLHDWQDRYGEVRAPSSRPESQKESVSTRS